jgi:hypothetical protein
VTNLVSLLRPAGIIKGDGEPIKVGSNTVRLPFLRLGSIAPADAGCSLGRSRSFPRTARARTASPLAVRRRPSSSAREDHLLTANASSRDRRHQGLWVKDTKNVIIAGLAFSKSLAPTDLVSIQHATNVVVDHCSFENDLNSGKDGDSHRETCETSGTVAD